MDILRHLNDRRLQLILLPTEKCNFRCTYCYEDYKMGVMPQTTEAVKRLISNRISELDVLEIGWFGGEPLLAEDVIFEISLHILNLLKNYQNVVYYAGMSTNGYLLKIPLVEKLESVGVKSFQITLDGSEEYHNQTRILTNNGGTFKTIWDNLLAIRDSSINVSITLRVHYSAEPFKKLNELIDNINTEFGTDSRFNIFFKSIEQLGGKNDSNINTLTEEQKDDILEILEGKVKNKNHLKKLENYICYAASPNCLVVRANGDICKCTVALDDLINKVGHLNSDGTMTMRQKLLTPWFKGFETLDANLLRCPLQVFKKCKAIDG